MLREIRLLLLNDGDESLVIHWLQFLSHTHKCYVLEFEYLANRMRRNLDYKHSPGFCFLVLIQFVDVGAYAHIPIYVTLKLPDTVKTLFCADNLMRIGIVHTYDDTTATLVTESSDISEDTPATLLWFVFTRTVIGYVSVFPFFELNVVFRLTHMLKLFYCISGHFQDFVENSTFNLLKSNTYTVISGATDE